ncbi:MAG: aspartate kinase [Planctomycetes bacterium]|nr:aspartate kinase [Planctomycetota bacterium]
MQKYGGASLATGPLVRHAAERVARSHRAGDEVVVVVSARGTATDDLLAQAREVSAGAGGGALDLLLSTGEQASAALLAIALESLGVRARALGIHEIGLRSDGCSGGAQVESLDPEPLRRCLAEGLVPVIPGFCAVAPDGAITTLGRGASDKTAVILAHALQADRCEVYKDVPAVLTADPRIVPEAAEVPELNYDEMLELSRTGAKVLQSDAVALAKKYSVPIEVRAFSSGRAGTRIGAELTGVDRAEVVAASLSMEESAITIDGIPDRPGQLARMFRTLADGGLNVDTIILGIPEAGRSQVCFSVPREDCERARAAAERLRIEIGAARVRCEGAIAKVAVVGVGMQSRQGVAARMFEALSLAGINILMVSTSEIKVACAVAESDGPRALRAVHAAFGLGRTPAAGGKG